MNIEQTKSITDDELNIGYATYYTKIGGEFVGPNDDYDFKYYVFTIGDEITLRGYFGQYSWLSDKSGFICGKEDGSFYYYNTAAEKLVYLDQTNPKKDMLGVYLNPRNNLAYYSKMDDNGYPQFWCVDPQNPTDKKLLFNAATAEMPRNPITGEELTINLHNCDGDINNFFKGLKLGIEVTNDGKYTYYNYHKHWTSPEHDNILGRVNLETGKLEYAYEINLREIDADGNVVANSNHINHIIINPEYPNLVLFNHPDIAPSKSSFKFYVKDLESGRLVHYTPRKSLWDNTNGLVYHMIWSYNGKYIEVTEGVRDNYAVYIDKDLLEKYNLGGDDNIEPVSRPVAHAHCAHFMLDEKMEWAMGDNEYEGVALFKMLDMEKYKNDTFIDTEYFNHVAYTDKVYKADLYIVRRGLQKDMDRCGIGSMINIHPYNPHPEISEDGRLCSWGDINRETGVLGIAWMENPFCK